MTREELKQLRKRVGKYMAMARSAAGMEAERFAKQVGMSYASYRKMIQGEQMPDVRKLMRAEKLSGVSLDLLDARIYTGLEFIREAAQAIEEGAAIKAIAAEVKCATDTLENCTRYIRDIYGSESENGIYAPGLPTVIKLADNFAALSEEQISKMYGASCPEEIGAKHYILQTFGPEIANTMREVGKKVFEFRTDSEYVIRIEVNRTGAWFRAFFIKEGRERLSTERRIRIA